MRSTPSTSGEQVRQTRAGGRLVLPSYEHGGHPPLYSRTPGSRLSPSSDSCGHPFQLSTTSTTGPAMHSGASMAAGAIRYHPGRFLSKVRTHSPRGLCGHAALRKEPALFPPEVASGPLAPRLCGQPQARRGRADSRRPRLRQLPEKERWRFSRAPGRDHSRRAESSDFSPEKFPFAPDRRADAGRRTAPFRCDRTMHVAE